MKKITRVKDAQSRVDFLRTRLNHEENAWKEYVANEEMHKANLVNRKMRWTRHYLLKAERKLALEERKAYEAVRFAK